MGFLFGFALGDGELVSAKYLLALARGRKAVPQLRLLVSRSSFPGTLNLKGPSHSQSQASYGPSEMCPPQAIAEVVVELMPLWGLGRNQRNIQYHSGFRV